MTDQRARQRQSRETFAALMQRLREEARAQQALQPQNPLAGIAPPRAAWEGAAAAPIRYPSAEEGQRLEAESAPRARPLNIPSPEDALRLEETQLAQGYTNLNQQPDYAFGRIPSQKEARALEDDQEVEAARANAQSDYSPLSNAWGPVVPIATTIADWAQAPVDAVGATAGVPGAQGRRDARDARWARGNYRVGSDVLDEGHGGQVMDFLADLPEAFSEGERARVEAGGRPGFWASAGDVLGNLWTGSASWGRDQRGEMAAQDVIRDQARREAEILNVRAQEAFDAGDFEEVARLDAQQNSLIRDAAEAQTAGDIAAGTEWWDHASWTVPEVIPGGLGELAVNIPRGLARGAVNTTARLARQEVPEIVGRALRRPAPHLSETQRLGAGTLTHEAAPIQHGVLGASAGAPLVDYAMDGDLGDPLQEVGGALIASTVPGAARVVGNAVGAGFNAARGALTEAAGTLRARPLPLDAPMEFEGAPRAPQVIDAEATPVPSTPQRNFQAAVRDLEDIDPETGEPRVYRGEDHQAAIESIPDDAVRARLQAAYDAPVEDPRIIGGLDGETYLDRDRWLQSMRAGRARQTVPVGGALDTSIRGDRPPSPIDWDARIDPQRSAMADLRLGIEDPGRMNIVSPGGIPGRSADDMLRDAPDAGQSGASNASIAPDGGSAASERVVYRGMSRPYDPADGGNYQTFTSSEADAHEYGSHVMAARLNRGRNLAINGGGNNFNSLSTAQLPADVRANLHPGVGAAATTDEVAHAARKAGYDSVTIDNVHDNRWGERPSANVPTRTIDIVFDTNNIAPIRDFVPTRPTEQAASGKVRLSDSDRALLAELEDFPAPDAPNAGPRLGGDDAAAIAGVGATGAAGAYTADQVFNQDAEASDGTDGEGNPIVPILGAGASLAGLAALRGGRLASEFADNVGMSGGRAESRATRRIGSPLEGVGENGRVANVTAEPQPTANAQGTAREPGSMLTDSRLNRDQNYAAGRAMDGASPRAIAEEMDTTASYVRVLLANARELAPDLEIPRGVPGRAQDGLTERARALRAQGLSYEEIGAELNMSASAAKSRVNLRRSGDGATSAAITAGLVGTGVAALAVDQAQAQDFDPNGRWVGDEQQRTLGDGRVELRQRFIDSQGRAFDGVRYRTQDPVTGEVSVSAPQLTPLDPLGAPDLSQTYDSTEVPLRPDEIARIQAERADRGQPAPQRVSQARGAAERETRTPAWALVAPAIAGIAGGRLGRQWGEQIGRPAAMETLGALGLGGATGLAAGTATDAEDAAALTALGTGIGGVGRGGYRAAEAGVRQSAEALANVRLPRPRRVRGQPLPYVGDDAVAPRSEPGSLRPPPARQRDRVGGSLDEGDLAREMSGRAIEEGRRRLRPTPVTMEERLNVPEGARGSLEGRMQTLGAEPLRELARREGLSTEGTVRALAQRLAQAARQDPAAIQRYRDVFQALGVSGIILGGAAELLPQDAEAGIGQEVPEWADEAGTAAALTGLTLMGRTVLPQALERVVPRNPRIGALSRVSEVPLDVPSRTFDLERSRLGRLASDRVSSDVDPRLVAGGTLAALAPIGAGTAWLLNEYQPWEQQFGRENAYYDNGDIRMEALRLNLRGISSREVEADDPELAAAMRELEAGADDPLLNDYGIGPTGIPDDIQEARASLAAEERKRQSAQRRRR